MKVYHGSYTEIGKVDLSQCRPRRDFGRGFYVTKFRPHAETWAKNIGCRHKTEGFVTEFEYNETDFSRHICKIKHFTAYDEEWLDFVVMNRDENNPEPAHDYDIVEGPVADDKVQNRIDTYLEGKISKHVFLEELKYHEETHQICFCTLNSLQVLKYANKTPRRNITDILEHLIEALTLDLNIDENRATEICYASATFALLADESTGLHIKTWHEIYAMLQKEMENNKNGK